MPAHFTKRETVGTFPDTSVLLPLSLRWSSRAPQCPVGSYNEGGNRDECAECPYGFSTADDATRQLTADDCLVAPGFEAVNRTVRECPLGDCAMVGERIAPLLLP